MLYEPFGASVADWKSGAYENNRKFTGKELDLDTGWHYYGSRYYASVEGRFLSEDPVFLELGSSTGTTSQLRDPQLWNSYAYARNNPVRMLDPDGQAFIDQLNSLTNAINFVGDVLTFGAFSNAVDSALAAGDRMAAENGSVSSVANAAYQVLAGTVTTGGAALLTGVSVGEAFLGYQSMRSGGGSGAYQLNNVEIRSTKQGETIYSGTRDLGPTMRSIESGAAKPRGTFGNYDQKLPAQADGYYLEYEVTNTPNWNQKGAGPERIVVGIFIPC